MWAKSSPLPRKFLCGGAPTFASWESIHALEGGVASTNANQLEIRVGVLTVGASAYRPFRVAHR
jgi:hypothetical protein